MVKHKKKIKLGKERVIMADVLPYEIPVTFSNRNFYTFIVDNKIEYSDGYLSWKKNNEHFDKVIEFFFNIKIDNNLIDEVCGIKKFRIQKGSPVPYKVDSLNTIPFSFKISHKQNDFRELKIIHPINQLALIDFYNRYKELIIYYCSKSNFSIRKPSTVARYTYFNDSKHKESRADESENDIIETLDKEYENLKTFFSYTEHSNIYRFYESYSYQRSEKKFNSLHKFDISKCFDSIYTHSLSWAINNKQIVKENLGVNDFTFGGAFDRLMQGLNYNETNGIVIGPEFSRIFAEILLQQIDIDVELELQQNDLIHKKHYRIYRYVDDYFLFFNGDNDKNKILEAFKHKFKEYGLYISEEKSFTYEKPIITDLTMAKERISDLLNEISLKSESIDIPQESEAKKQPQKYSLYFNSKKAIIGIKTIVKETRIEYKDILNYVFAVIDKKLYKIIKKYNRAIFESKEKEIRFKSVFESFIIELLDFVMFLYSVHPRANVTIKLCSLLTKIINFINDKTESLGGKYFEIEQRDYIFKKIYDDISLILNKNTNSAHTQIETLYLLIVLKELGREYRLSEKVLLKYLDITNNQGIYVFPYDFNLWTISVVLFYVRDIDRYKDFKTAIFDSIEKRFSLMEKCNVSKNTELVLLAVDLLSCPYVSKKQKKRLLSLCNLDTCKDDIISIFGERKNMFTKWHNFDFHRELNTKKSKEVY